MATVEHNSNWEISGTVTLGTEAFPLIVYVEGNVITTGPVVFSGWGMIIAKGNFEINHDTSVSGGAGTSWIGMYTNGNISVKERGLSVVGQWLLNGNLELEQYTSFSGTITTGGNCIFDKTFSGKYVQASSQLTKPIWPFGGGDPETVGDLNLVGGSSW